MYTDLRGHEIYEKGFQNAVRDFISLIDKYVELPFSIWSKIWFMIFGAFMITPLLLYLKKPIESKLIGVITMQITLLSIFFISNHSKHILWLIPWLLFWSFYRKGSTIYSPIFVFYGYFLRRLRVILPGKFLFGDIVLGLTGIWIISLILIDLNKSSSSSLKKPIDKKNYHNIIKIIFCIILLVPGLILIDYKTMNNQYDFLDKNANYIGYILSILGILLLLSLHKKISRSIRSTTHRKAINFESYSMKQNNKD